MYTEPPKMRIKQMLSNGTIELEFDQNMIIPGSIMDPELYNKLFSISLEPSAENKTNIHGLFVGNSSSITRRLQAAKTRGMNLTVVEHSSRRIKIDIDFSNKEEISRDTKKDKLVVSIL
jgi:hypothetical protein